MVSKGTKSIFLFQLFIYPILTGIILILVSIFSEKLSVPNIFMGLWLALTILSLPIINLHDFVKEWDSLREDNKIRMVSSSVAITLFCINGIFLILMSLGAAYFFISSAILLVLYFLTITKKFNKVFLSFFSRIVG